MTLKERIEGLLGVDYVVHVEESHPIAGEDFIRVVTMTSVGGYEVVSLFNKAAGQEDEEIAQMVFDNTIASGVAEE